MDDDQIARTIATARALNRVHELAREPLEVALVELESLLRNPATNPGLLPVILAAIRVRGTAAASLAPAVQQVADQHDVPVRQAARRTLKAIRGE